MTQDIFQGILYALGGGIGLKVIEWLMSRSKQKLLFAHSEAAAIRQELWSELKVLRVHNEHLQVELDAWKGKYYEMVKTQLELRNENDTLRAQLDK